MFGIVQFLQVILLGFLKVINRYDIKLVSQYSRCPPEIFLNLVSRNEIMYYSDMSRIAILKLLGQLSYITWLFSVYYISTAHFPGGYRQKSSVNEYFPRVTATRCLHEHVSGLCKYHSGIV
jgi:hypothetical protein